MRVTFQMEGGLSVFPGLSKPTSFDSSELSPEDAAALQELVAACCFFDLAPPPPQATGHDRRSYSIGIEDGGRHKKMRLSEPLPPELAELVRHLLALGKKRRVKTKL